MTNGKRKAIYKKKSMKNCVRMIGAIDIPEKYKYFARVNLPREGEKTVREWVETFRRSGKLVINTKGGAATGKTVFAYALAGELRLPLGFVDLGAEDCDGQKIENLFCNLRKVACAVVLIERFAGANAGAAKQILAEVQSEQNAGLLFVFESHEGEGDLPFYANVARFTLPNEATRAQIIRNEWGDIPLAEGVSPEAFAARSEGANCLELSAAANECVYSAIEEFIQTDNDKIMPEYVEREIKKLNRAQSRTERR